MENEINMKLDACRRVLDAIVTEASGAYDHTRMDNLTVEWVEGQLVLVCMWSEDIPPVGAMVQEVLDKFSDLAKAKENSQELVRNRTWSWIIGACETIEYAVEYLRGLD